jgi:hypothetical protein
MALTERIQKTTDVGYWTGKIPLEYLYTYGRAGETFFRSLKDRGVFTGAKCDKCDVVYVPPRIYCEQCFERLEDKYVEVAGVGEVYTYTILTKNLDGTKKDQPEIVAFILLDGTDGGLVHRLGECGGMELDIGMPVEAVLKPEAEREGSINDVLYFKPR